MSCIPTPFRFVFGAALVLLSACAGERTPVDPPLSGAGAAVRQGEGGGEGDDGDDGDSCVPGTVEDCLVWVGEQGGRETCFPGTRKCDRHGVWSRCRKTPPGQSKHEG